MQLDTQETVVWNTEKSLFTSQVVLYRLQLYALCFLEVLNLFTILLNNCVLVDTILGGINELACIHECADIVEESYTCSL